MSKFKEWLAAKDAEVQESFGKEASDPDEEKGKIDGWQPEVQDEINAPQGKQKPTKPTILVQNMSQWSDKDRTAK